MAIAHLSDRAVLSVSGAEAKAFLQGLITNDMARVAPGRAIFAALLTPQGKVIADFFVAERDGAYLIDANAAQAENLLKRLKMYRLRAAIDLATRPDLAVFAVWDRIGHLEQPAEWTAVHDPRLPVMGRRIIAPAGDTYLTANAETGLAAYTDHRLTLGVPDSPDTAGQFLLDANGEELHGVDFKKGCYVGQEVTARMKHKAAPRRRLVPIAVEGGTPATGVKLLDAAGIEVGEFATGQAGKSLASVRLDRLKAAVGLTAEGDPARVVEGGYPLPHPPSG